MDLIGITMGIVTIPMAVLTLAGIAGALGLIAVGAWQPLGIGAVAIAAGLAVAFLIERVVAIIDGAAITVARRHGRGAGLWIGLIGGVLPMAAILAWEWHWASPFFDGRLALRLWSYAIATLPWTLFALRTDGNRRTLSGIRAYAAHIAFWVMIVLRTWIDAPGAVVVAAMLLPAILPISVGTLLAVADRDALRNVRI